MTKFIFITGGVLSGLGKGTVAASIARLLQWRGFNIKLVKIDPYLNLDAGTMNPIEHGEVFVTEDVWEFEPVPGISFRIAEIDQDFGTYERFTGINVHPKQNITSGQIFLSTILKERRGIYLGKTVQIIPHVTNEIKDRILSTVDTDDDIVIVEVGGTVGDIEGMPYLEAIRQLRYELKPDDTMLIHVTFLPYLKTIGQLKTKPTQHSVYKLMESGLIPDAIVTRSEHELNEASRRKISLLTGVPIDAIVSCSDMEVVYEVPLHFEKQNFGEIILKKLSLTSRHDPLGEIREWQQLILRFKKFEDELKIGIVGKYTNIKDSYISINEALKHAGAAVGSKIELIFIDAKNYEEKNLEKLDGILLTPGFGERAAEGMIKSAIYALKTNKPFLGICFGAQLGTVAFAREIMGWKDANSTEINPNTSYPVIDLLPGQKGVEAKGGTMRLGGIKINLKEQTKLWKEYKTNVIVERFRHRYHIMEEYASKMSEKGYTVNAIDEDGNIVGFEIEYHDFFVGVQWHPEYKSRPFAPSPTYLAFIKAVKEKRY
ncbi:MAG: CTP synthase [Candidatus Njordarchaeia archaeon]